MSSPTLRVAGPAARAHAAQLAVAAVLVLLRTAAVLLRPWPLALAVDHALTGSGPLLGISSPPIILALAGVATVALSALLGLLDMSSERYAEGAAEKIGADLRATVFDTAMTRSLRWHDRMRSGELVSRLTTDVGRLLDGIVAIGTTLVPDVLMLVVVLVLITTLDPTLAIVGLSVVPVLAVLAIRQRRLVRAAQVRAREESGRLVTTSSDLLRNVRAVQAFGRGDRAAAVFGARNRALLDVELRAVGVESRWAPISDLVLAVGSALVLGIGGAHVLSGTLSTGRLLVVLAYLRDLYSPVRGLTRLSTVLAKSAASAARVSDVLDCADAVEDVPNARPAPLLRHGVRLDRIGFAYEPGRPVLNGLDLTIRAGETVCLFGPSGIGKSTVLHLLLRLYDVDSGRILYDDTDIRALDQRSLRERIAYMPQDPWLLDATLAENIAFGSRTATRAEVLAAGRSALVDEFALRLPDGYDTVLGEAGVRLSGGQRRRVALARAAVSRASMVLLDEPTASLDPRSAAAVVQAIRGATAGRTVLVVTHDRDLAAIADRVAELHIPPQFQPQTLPAPSREEVTTS
jgi:ATP-binding cassette subfamily B protein